MWTIDKFVNPEHTAGLKAIFVSRPGKSLYPLSRQPDYVVKDFSDLVKLLKSKNIK
jgi:FMN phosphatase YigB (HAD superfamily)